MNLLILYFISIGEGVYVNLGAGIGSLKYGAFYVSTNWCSEDFFISGKFIHGQDFFSASKGYLYLFYYFFCHLTQIHDTCSGFSYSEFEKLTELSILSGLRKKYKDFVFYFSAGPGIRIFRIRKNNFNKEYTYHSLCLETQIQYILLQFLGVGFNFSFNITPKQFIPFLFFGVQIGKFY